MRKMAEIPKDMKFLLFGMGPKWHARVAMVSNSIGMVTLIISIISAAADNALGLGAGNWFLLTITLFLWGLSAWLCAYFGAKEE
jgi:hypothetical protein